ncbi:hypothetical protein [Rhodopirellula bahusiensis]|uniref:hypothetical protein n=1 Tax=Rhodopirellula bahusiensis TaxID=2014065 RepID=UPI0032643CEF
MARDINIKIGATDMASSVFSKVTKNVAGMDKKVSALASRLKTNGQGLVKWGGITTGVVGGAIAGIVDAASDSEETMGKFDVVFGASAKVMEAWGDKTADALGVSEDAMAEMLSGMQDLLVPMGVVPNAAGEMSKTLSTLAVDLGSFNNESSDKVFEDLQAAMTGSGEVMKKYGVILSESAVKQELLNQGLDPKIATNAQKAQARLNIIMAGTTAAQGDAIRTSGSLANQMKRLGAVSSDITGMLGAGLIGSIKETVSWLVQGGKSIKTFIGENQPLVAAAGKSAIAIAGIGIAGMGIGGGLIFAGAAVTGLQAIVAAASAGITAALSPIVAPIIGLTIAGVGLGTVFGVMAYKSGLLSGSLEEATGFVRAMLSVAKQTFGGIADAITAGDWELAAKVGMAGVKVAFATGLESVYHSFVKLSPKLAETIKTFFTWWIEAALDAATTVAKIVTNPATAATEAFKFLKGNSLSFDVKVPEFGKMLREQRIAAQKELNALSQDASDAAETARAAADGKSLVGGMVHGLAGGVQELPNMIAAAISRGESTLGQAVSSMSGKLGIEFKNTFADQIKGLGNQLENELNVAATVSTEFSQQQTGHQGNATEAAAKIMRQAKDALSSMVGAVGDLGPMLSNAFDDGLSNLSDIKIGDRDQSASQLSQPQSIEIQATQTRLLTGIASNGESEQRASEANQRKQQLAKNNALLERGNAALDIIAKHITKLDPKDPIEIKVIT